MSSCPFLGRLSMNAIKSNTFKVLQRISDCPVMSAVTRKYSSDPHYGIDRAAHSIAAMREPGNDTIRKCPFLSRKLDSKIEYVDPSQSDDMKNVGAEPGAKELPKQRPFHPLLERTMKGNTDLKGSENCLFRESEQSADEIAIQYCGVCGTSASHVDSHTHNTEAVNSSDTVGSEKGSHNEPRLTNDSVFNYEEVFQSLIDKKKNDHTYRIFKKIERKGKEFPKAREHTGFDKEVTVWCSNDYMGMGSHPAVVQAAKSTIDAQGTGSGGTRNISGNLILHERLERTMAEHHDKEAALVFTSCYVANQWALNSLGRYLPGCVIISDENNHASMIEGIRSSGAKKMIYKHNCLVDLESKLKTVPKGTPAVVAFESVHSMSGTMSPIEAVCDLAHSYGAITYLDEVHAVGLYGDRGAGAAEEFGCVDKVDILTGTFGKAFGNIGGYVAASANLIDFLRSYSSGFIFTTSLPPPVLAGALTAVQVLAGDEGRRLRQQQRTIVRTLRQRLKAARLPAAEVPTHIIPVHVGDAARCLEISNQLLHSYNIYVQSINYPTVARGQECLRIAPTPLHTLEDVDRLIKALSELWAKLGGPYLPEGTAELAA